MTTPAASGPAERRRAEPDQAVPDHAEPDHAEPDRAPGGDDRAEGSARGPARWVVVHAHPDDESLATGILLAHAAAAGDEVHLITCTLGEEGDVIPVDQRHLERADGDPAAPVRRAELRAATAALGVTSSEILGEDPGAGVLSRYRDSGMTGAEAGQAQAMWTGTAPHTFAAQPIAQVGEELAARLLELAPTTVVTYDPSGGYGHPDHVQTHRVTMTALASMPPPLRPRALEIVTPRSWVAQDRALVAARLAQQPEAYPNLSRLGEDDPVFPSVVEDDEVSWTLRDPAAKERKIAALRAHRTQVTVYSDEVYALSNDIATRLTDREAYRVVDPVQRARQAAEAAEATSIQATAETVATQRFSS